ncbi:DUF58 domain-containing protein [Novosphingobium sp. TH158]|uniref:DUF58 domain-containing protein n=1 Tax=Novosphingobium sp. TH158 TaxID=2067455 RepID=UPI000C7AD25E|nr:DUF58 domain-containing protein [Novosphingobium sp. TH158]PLK27924.1 DUF58 domain-containing protein [Novosphingobium sp. TH158]
MLAALAAPVALVVAAAAPAAWVAVPALGLTLLALVLLDAWAAGPCHGLRLIAPGDCEVGEEARIAVIADLPGSVTGRADVALSLDPRLADGGRLDIRLRRDGETGTWQGGALTVPSRRGTGLIDKAWLRWTGPLGIGARQREVDLAEALRVWPNLSTVRSPALQAYLRDSQFGLIARRMRGEGTQFEALAEYQPGMDRRRIDWKASARHMHLYAKEFENERNNQIVFAFDCGQSMCEPVAGLPRIDRAVSAALATAYVALKGGDRVALYGFAARPEIFTPFVADARDFHRLQRAAAGLDYHAQEPNFTLALASLAGRLARRSLIVIFSDFTDPTSAELMIESVSRLVSRHVVLFVAMSDAELEEIAEAEPEGLGELAMAVSADGLLRQRAVVLQRLRQIGVDVVEAPWNHIGMAVIDAYLKIKRGGRIG